MYKASICSTIKNRSVVETEHGVRYLFKNFLLSIQQSFYKSNLELELVLCDFQSTDVDDLHSYTSSILDNKDIDIKVITLQQKFNRGLGCNTAIEASMHDHILLLDVDMKFDENLFENFIHHVCQNKNAYFPICYTFENDPTENEGFWLDTGYGNFGILKKSWLDAGKIPQYNEWGQEDLHFYKKLKCHKVRDKCKNLIHQWHPSSIEWKNRFY